MSHEKNKEMFKGIFTFMVMILVIVFILVGCTTAVPVTAKFPEAPGKGAMERCPDLNRLQEGAKLSDVANTVTINYETYYSCAVKSDTWQEWYEIQKRIFESAGK